MGFEEEYRLLIDYHLAKRDGERKRRLKEGHSKAEKLFLENVWWPCFHNFQFLHPEYEVQDFKDGKRYLDFAYVRAGIRICFEIDGYSSHMKNVSRWQFADNLERQNQLVIDGWTVIRFSYDQLVEQSRRCQHVIHLIVSKVMGTDQERLTLTSIEKDIVRIAIACQGKITPADIYNRMNVSDKTTRKILSELVKKGIIYPVGGEKRIRSYQLREGVQTPFK